MLIDKDEVLLAIKYASWDIEDWPNREFEAGINALNIFEDNLDRVNGIDAIPMIFIEEYFEKRGSMPMSVVSMIDEWKKSRCGKK